MENKSHALLAGLFTILLGVAVAVSLLWLGGKKEQTREYLVVTTQNVSGLNPQAQVRYRGIRVGKVREIRLDPDNVRNILILIDVNASVPVTRGTVAKLAYQGITGLAHVLLEDAGKNTEPLLPSDDGDPPKIAMGQSLFDELGEAGAGTLKQAQSFFANASDTLNEQNRKTLSNLLVNLEQNTVQLNKLLSDTRVQNIGSAIERVDKAADKAEIFFTQTKTLIPKVDKLVGNVESLVGTNNSEGAMATLAQVNALTGELSATSQQLSRTLRLFEQAPESVIFGPPPVKPGPGEPGFNASISGRKP